MCSYKVLFHKSTGYVVKCNSCDNYQVAFGTMVFTISTGNMEALFQQVKQMKCCKTQANTHRNERFQVKLPCESVIMALNNKELGQFHNMLDEAFTIEELKKMLAENNIGK